MARESGGGGTVGWDRGLRRGGGGRLTVVGECAVKSAGREAANWENESNTSSHVIGSIR